MGFKTKKEWVYTKKYTCYKCRNKISEEDLEEAFQHQLKDFFSSSKKIENYLTEADEVKSSVAIDNSHFHIGLFRPDMLTAVVVSVRKLKHN